VQLTNIVSFPCEHFSVAQDTLSGPRFSGGTFGSDHLVDRAAIARNSEVGPINGDGRLIFKLPLMRSVRVVVAAAGDWNVRFWHLADIGLCAANVRYWG
jgi:hypothetical protein